MVDIEALTYINGLSALVVVCVAWANCIYFLVEFIRKRKKLAPFVSLLFISQGTFFLGVTISFFYLLIFGSPFEIIPAAYIAYSLVPVAIISAMYLGFTIFNPEWLKKVLLIYGASVIVFYVFMIGFPNDSLGGQLFMSLPDTTLKGVPMVLAVVYILSTFFVLGLGFYKLAKRIHEPQKQKKLMYLFWGFVVFGVGSAMEILIPTYVIFIARILEIVSSYLLYKGFSA